jgi:hypothetical protein
MGRASNNDFSNLKDEKKFVNHIKKDDKNWFYRLSIKRGGMILIFNKSHSEYTYGLTNS